MLQHFEEIPFMDPMMQNAIIEVIQKDASLNPANKVFSHRRTLMIAQISPIDFRFAGIVFSYRCL